MEIVEKLQPSLQPFFVNDLSGDRLRAVGDAALVVLSVGFVAVASIPSALSRADIVLMLSSAARIPLPSATRAFAVSASADELMVGPPVACLLSGQGIYKNDKSRSAVKFVS